MRARTILHVCLHGLCAGLAIRKHPQLQGRAFVVATRQAGSRILDVSPEAARAGLRTGDALWRARMRYPDLPVIAPDHAGQEAARRRAQRVMLRFTPQVQLLGLTGAFMDVTASLRMCGGRQALAERLQEELARQVEVTATVGMAENPLLARIASGLADPGGVHSFFPLDPAEALDPLPLSVLWPIAEPHRQRLACMGVTTCGQLRAVPSALLQREFGDAGRLMFEACRGRDESVIPVCEEGDPVLTIRHEVEFTHPTREDRVLRQGVLAAAEGVADALQARGQAAHRIKLALIFMDRTRLERTRRLTEPACMAPELVRHAGEMLPGLELRVRRCVALELVALDLVRATARQMSLFGEGAAVRSQVVSLARRRARDRSGVTTAPACLAETGINRVAA